MELRILNTSFVATNIVESFESIIWTERYRRPGDFELRLKFSPDLLNIYQEDYYLIKPDTEVVMIIESLGIKTDKENGDKLIVKGRSLSSILDRRIVLAQTLLDTTLQSAVQTLLNDNVINSIYSQRNIPGFTFITSSDPLITTPTLKGQYYSQYILDVIQDLCEKADIGFKLTLNSSNNFEFRLYSGKDRSYNQLTNPYVVFSPNFGNLVSGEYFQTRAYKKTYALITGQAPSAFPAYPIRRQVWLNGINTSGLERREMHVDASDMSIYNESTGTEMSDTEYGNQIEQRGEETLAQYTELVAFDGQIDLSNSYIYRTDFFLGDIIQMTDNYGNSSSSQILEMTFSEDLNGSSIYPTLKTV